MRRLINYLCSVTLLLLITIVIWQGAHDVYMLVRYRHVPVTLAVTAVSLVQAGAVALVLWSFNRRPRARRANR